MKLVASFMYTFLMRVWFYRRISHIFLPHLIEDVIILEHLDDIFMINHYLIRKTNIKKLLLDVILFIYFTFILEKSPSLVNGSPPLQNMKFCFRGKMRHPYGSKVAEIRCSVFSVSQDVYLYRISTSDFAFVGGILSEWNLMLYSSLYVSIFG